MTLPIPTETPPRTERRKRRRAAPTSADYAAQVLGQDGRKRGLKGGPETLEAARTAYLSAEYSGDHDRRPQPGLVRREEV